MGLEPVDQVEEDVAQVRVGGVAGGIGGAAGEGALQQLVQAALVDAPEVLGALPGVDHGATDGVGEQGM